MSKPKVGTLLLPQELRKVPAQFLVKGPLENSFGSNRAQGLGLDIGKCVFMHPKSYFWMCELSSIYITI